MTLPLEGRSVSTWHAKEHTDGIWYRDTLLQGGRTLMDTKLYKLSNSHARHALLYLRLPWESVLVDEGQLCYQRCDLGS